MTNPRICPTRKYWRRHLADWDRCKGDRRMRIWSKCNFSSLPSNYMNTFCDQAPCLPSWWSQRSSWSRSPSPSHWGWRPTHPLRSPPSYPPPGRSIVWRHIPTIHIKQNAWPLAGKAVLHVLNKPMRKEEHDSMEYEEIGNPLKMPK